MISARYAVFIIPLLSVVAAWGAAESPWVANDRTIDTSSYETIVKGVCKEGMTDEQKAIAMYSFFRQMVYHYQNIPESRDPIKCINVIGNTLCGSQGTCMKGLLEAAGIKARVVSHPGHTFYEAFYDGKWHGFDTMSNFYVMTRGEKPSVASFEELKNDPTLISDAKKDGRACPNICPCGDNPMAFKDPIQVLNYEPLKTAWSVKNYRLRPGEEIVRSWWPMGKPLPGTTGGKDQFAHHTCGGRDSDAEPALFKFWEPYLIRNFGRASRSYRHYFNGVMNYSPDLTNDECRDGATLSEGLKPTSEGLAGEGSYVFPVKCPFYITAGVLYFEAACANDGDSVALSVSADGKTWTPVVSADKGTQVHRGVLDKTVVKPTTGLHDYQVKFELKGKAVLKHLYLRTTFHHNAMSAPHLMPGKNKITLSVSNSDVLKTHPVTVAYRYKDAPQWSELKTIEKVADTSPFTFEADLPETEKLPQMQDLTIRCGKIAWVPPGDKRPDKVVADFSNAEVLAQWKADEGMKLTPDGGALLIEVPQKAPYPQASADAPKEDWSSYKTALIELENLGPKSQEVVFRVRSGGDNKNRADTMERVAKGKTTMRVQLASLKQVNLKDVDKVYLLMQNVPDEGCKIKVTKICLEPDRDL